MKNLSATDKRWKKVERPGPPVVPILKSPAGQRSENPKPKADFIYVRDDENDDGTPSKAILIPTSLKALERKLKDIYSSDWDIKQIFTPESTEVTDIEQISNGDTLFIVFDKKVKQDISVPIPYKRNINDDEVEKGKICGAPQEILEMYVPKKERAPKQSPEKKTQILLDSSNITVLPHSQKPEQSSQSTPRTSRSPMKSPAKKSVNYKLTRLTLSATQNPNGTPRGLENKEHKYGMAKSRTVRIVRSEEDPNSFVSIPSPMSTPRKGTETPTKAENNNNSEVQFEDLEKSRIQTEEKLAPLKARFIDGNEASPDSANEGNNLREEKEEEEIPDVLVEEDSKNNEPSEIIGETPILEPGSCNSSEELNNEHSAEPEDQSQVYDLIGGEPMNNNMEELKPKFVEEVGTPVHNAKQPLTVSTDEFKDLNIPHSPDHINSPSARIPLPLSEDEEKDGMEEEENPEPEEDDFEVLKELNDLCEEESFAEEEAENENK